MNYQLKFTSKRTEYPQNNPQARDDIDFQENK